MPKLIDFTDLTVKPNVLTPAHRYPARGLEHMEQTGRFFHVVNAKPSHGQQLADSFGQEGTLLIDGGSWRWEDVPNQIDILNKTGGPCRIVVHNLGHLNEDHCWPLEQLMKNQGVKSWWFVDEGSETIPTNIDHKVLMECQMADAAVLLDAVAFGWGAKNPYDGKAVGGEEADLSDKLDLSGSEVGAPEEEMEYANW